MSDEEKAAKMPAASMPAAGGMPKDLGIRRILVALDASTGSLAALAAAAELAASLEAELLGLFVEDENLVHLSGLPFASEVRSLSATSRQMNRNQMEADLRLQATQARRALEAAATRAHARWSFQVVRGQVTESILSAALEADLLAMGRIGRPLSRRSHLGSTARAAMAGSSHSVLLVQHGRHLNCPILVTFDGSQPAKQALQAATRLAQSTGNLLNIILLGKMDERGKLHQEVAELLIQTDVHIRYHWLLEVAVNDLVEVIRSAGDCVLVLGGKSPFLEAASVQELLDKTDCPVMLVR